MAVPAAALLFAAAALGATAPADDAPPSLRGVFPESVPRAVGGFAFDELGPNWADWAEDTAAAVTALYDPTATAKQQRAAVLELRRAVGQLDAAAKDPAFAPARRTIGDLRGALARRTRLAAATLDALEAAADAPADAARRGADRRLGEALGTLRAALAATPGGAGWLPVARADRLDRVANGEASPAGRRALAAVVTDLEDPTVYEEDRAAFLSRPAWRRLAAAAAVRLAVAPDPDASVGETPTARDAATVALRQFAGAFERFERDGTDEAARALTGAAGDLAAVVPAAGPDLRGLLAGLYDGDNYRVFVGEGFLRRFVAQTRRERGSVKDTVFGTRVTGTQETDVAVDVDVRPEVGAARFDVTLVGVARTDTIGLNRQARVTTAGVHRFAARKTMVYDGTRFRGGRTVVDVNPFLRNTRIETIYDDLAGGLLRDFIQERAFAEADRRQPAALARAERTLERALRPQLDRQLTEQFDVVNLRAGGLLRRRLARLGLAPSRETVSSTDREMRVFGRLSEPDELAAPRPPARPFTDDGVVVQLHQTAINNAADRLNLAGRTVTPDQLGEILTAFAGDLLGRELDPPPAAPDADGEEPPTLTFAEADPIRVGIAADTVTLTLRVGLAAPPKADGTPAEDVPPQRVSVPFRVSLTGSGDLRLTRGDLSVAPLGRPASRFRQQAIARVLRSRLGEAIPAEETVPAKTVVATDARTRVALRLATLTLADGWATGVLR